MKRPKPITYKLDNDFSIPYQPLHQDYGRAMFSVCAKFVRGKLKRLQIDRRWQVKIESFLWENPPASRDIVVGQNATVWLLGQCREHNGLFFHVYVPPGTNRLRVSLLSTVSLYFEGGEK